MLELPEAQVLAGQLNKTVKGKRVSGVIAAQNPHKFAWFAGDPQSYAGLLTGRIFGMASGLGGLVEIQIEDTTLTFGDGVALKFHDQNEPRPTKHQLLIEFERGSAMSGTVQMYGGLWCYKAGTFHNPYHEAAQEKPYPLSAGFDKTYFEGLMTVPQARNLSLKAFLATEQRIPGLGNGVLQDILFAAGMHPKKKVSTLSEADKEKLLTSVKSTLSRMIEQGGRDTEKDLFGLPGGYITSMSKNTGGKSCPACGAVIKKEAYLGGSIYFCEKCQLL